ncbi:DUF4416 family protein [Desulfotignum phosphitoxidans]|uniref:GTP-binding protein n=1 Tax=Desulfotignum phosphitoxidans DSM 13687 TaxID=1286635 RepID=S0G5P0_9BACT|nr:DUF4416 family protein [Desulfotignum phosphitoxidans]EMS79867.1 hypothetical protein Dpo_3c00090 [Desulfotignum phosphitoxidans DSM 13687]
MSVPKMPDPAKLVMSVFMKEKPLFESVFPLLETIGGPVDLVSRWLDFDFTTYYHKEMGHPLFRRILAFKSLVDQADLSKIKQATNAVEQQFVKDQQRRINIDPGYLLPSRFVLATGKDYAHRIYIGDHMYADLTLMYVGKQFVPLDWTYPDYRSKEIVRFLEQVRDKYLLDLKAVKRSLS